MNDLAGQGFDGQVDPITGAVRSGGRAGLERQLRTLVQRDLAIELHVWQRASRQQCQPAGDHVRLGEVRGGQFVVAAGAANVVWHRVLVWPTREPGRSGSLKPNVLLACSSTTSERRYMKALRIGVANGVAALMLCRYWLVSSRQLVAILVSAAPRRLDRDDVFGGDLRRTPEFPHDTSTCDCSRFAVQRDRDVCDQQAADGRRGADHADALCLSRA